MNMLRPLDLSRRPQADDNPSREYKPSNKEATGIKEIKKNVSKGHSGKIQ